MDFPPFLSKLERTAVPSKPKFQIYNISYRGIFHIISDWVLNKNNTPTTEPFKNNQEISISITGKIQKMDTALQEIVELPMFLSEKIRWYCHALSV